MINLSIIEDLENKFNGQIPNLVYFSIGIGFGIVLFLITYLIIFIINKTKINGEKDTYIVKTNEQYKVIIDTKKDEFTELHKNSSLKEKVNSILRIFISMLEEISSLYYPDSDDPMFEISIDRLVDLIEYSMHRINLIIDDILIDKLRFVEIFTKKEIRNIKLSTIFDLINKRNNEINNNKENKGIFSKIKENITKGVKKVGLSITGGIVNNTFYSLIDDIGEDINKLYSNQPLVFTDISKKETRARKKQLRKLKKENKKKVGDDYA